MSDEWWEPGLNESRILFLYRRYDAISHLMGSIPGDLGVGQTLLCERQMIMADICAEFPRSGLDFAAQTVILCQSGEIEVSAQELQACIALLNRHIESSETRPVEPQTARAADGINAWCSFRDLVVTPAAKPARARLMQRAA